MSKYRVKYLVRHDMKTVSKKGLVHAASEITTEYEERDDLNAAKRIYSALRKKWEEPRRGNEPIVLDITLEKNISEGSRNPFWITEEHTSLNEFIYVRNNP